MAAPVNPPPFSEICSNLNTLRQERNVATVANQYNLLKSRQLLLVRSLLPASVHQVETVSPFPRAAIGSGIMTTDTGKEVTTMTTWHELREGMSRAWDSLSEGWQHLFQRASGAMTRYLPLGHKEESEGSPTTGTGWGLLAAEVSEGPKQVRVRLEAPGLDPDEINLRVEGNLLVVSGEKHYQNEQSDGRFHIRECAYGRFERAIPLPTDVDPDAATASYRRGVLQIELPRRKGTPGKRIPVKSS